MPRGNITLGQILRILTKWHDVPAGTLGTVETVTSRWDGEAPSTLQMGLPFSDDWLLRGASFDDLE
jgi:hypothetical protein